MTTVTDGGSAVDASTPTCEGPRPPSGGGRLNPGLDGPTGDVDGLRRHLGSEDEMSYPSSGLEDHPDVGRFDVVT